MTFGLLVYRLVFEPAAIGYLFAHVTRVEVVLVHDATEARGIIGIAMADIFATFGVGAKRPLELDALSREVVYKVRGDNLLGRWTLLHPLLERLHTLRGASH